MIRSHCKTNVFVVFHKQNHTVCTHMFVLKEKNWKRILASAYWPPAHPIPPTHNSHPQVTLGSCDCSSFLCLRLHSRGSQILLEPSTMEAISCRKPSLIPPARTHLFLPYYLCLLVPFCPSVLYFKLLYS